MNDHDRDEERTEEARRGRVRITDKRRVHSGEGAAPAARGRDVDSGDAPEAGSREEPASSRDELARVQAQAAEYLEHLQRLKAEFDNYRKRVLREQTRAVEHASEGLVARLLEVLDEFELALVAAGREQASDRLARGVELVYAKLFDILKAEGLERIDARGKPFDPELHEALLQSDGDEEGEAYVEDVLRTGYTLKGRVLRPAGVKVGRR
ncbi:MAG: nucleotide exchange factor GrpE [Actinomycetota bacterium]